ncbi:DUF488 domain-containing protein [Bradyrhizobium sp. SYSU BS000235]|uniref:DUF488 domain-containing protein n=1 Tax=Bradyrhizobium sp. SYSU BS000235 TaxID=3411332 RepID=UPI003C70A680
MVARGQDIEEAAGSQEADLLPLESLERCSSMSSIKTKRIYEKPATGDGLRILVDRLWPRGVRKEAAALDQWCKEIAPTPELRKWFDHREDRFTEFKTRYLHELKHNPVVPELLQRIGSRNSTLLYAAHDPAINHAVVLASFLEKQKAKK